jgi:DNA invertase Pin-like site-specific DNA recombinase
MRVIIAGRLSKKATDRDQTGFDSQERESVRWAEQNGHRVVTVVADFKSGRSRIEDRPNLRPWVTDPERLSQYDGIVALKVDRLTRGNRQETADLESWANEHGKVLLIAGLNVRSDAEGMEGMAWDMMLRQAHQEWLNTSERYGRMRRTLIEKGSVVSKAPWG